MKSSRRIVTLLLCLFLVCLASSASAASKTPSKTFTAVPTIKFTDVPSSGTASGSMNDLTISASIPGFLTLCLTDEAGNVVQTIAKNMEIPSSTSTFDFYAVDDDGEPLPVGNYMFSAEMVSQFGVTSKVFTRKTTVKESKEKTTTTVKTSSASSSKSSSSSTTTKATAAPKATATPKPTATPKATPVPETLEYGAGEFKMGDEGLLIGVGVEDVAAQEDAGYWSLSANSTDAELWAAITRKMVGVDVGESESAYIYDSPETGRAKIGTVSGISQGLNVIAERDDGWALVEAYRNEDGAFVRGYIKADKLRPVDPNPNYGIVIDKAAQTLTVLKDGVRVGSCRISTGLATPKYPHRETPAGEFITVTRRGAFEYYGMGYTKYTIRFNSGYYLAEIPTTKKNGTKFIEEIQNALGTKSTRGTVCIDSEASTDGGINAKWIWDMTDENKRVKVLIFDDKPRTDVPLYSK